VFLKENVTYLVHFGEWYEFFGPLNGRKWRAIIYVRVPQKNSSDNLHRMEGTTRLSGIEKMQGMEVF
jgi:hypothetical protein